MNDIKIPRLDSDDAANKQEIKVFCRQVVAELSYLRDLLERILENAEG